MTDKELRDAAVAHLKKTTTGYAKSNGQPKPPPWPDGSAHWATAMDLLAQIGQVPVPPDPPPPSGGGTLIFSANYETAGSPPACPSEYDSMASPNNSLQFPNTGQVATVTAENGVTPRRGSKMLRMEVRPGETAPWGASLQAAAIQKNPGVLPNIGLGFDNYQGISFYIQPGLEYLNPNMHCYLLEWHGTAQMLQAPFHFGLNCLNGMWLADLQRTSAYSYDFIKSIPGTGPNGAAQQGVWMNVVSGIRWRSDNTGYYKLWLKPSGTGPMTPADLKVDQVNIPTWNTTGAAIYPEVVLYRHPFPTLGRVYFDSHRIGDTLAVVDPENYV